MEKLKLAIHKLTHWEYWPFDVVYIPMYFVWFYYAAKARSFFFFNAANPRIKNAGFLMESKKEIYDIIPTQYIPKTLFFKNGAATAEILKTVADANIAYQNGLINTEVFSILVIMGVITTLTTPLLLKRAFGRLE